MVQISEQATPTKGTGDARPRADRRRPGRSGAVSPALLPLLRQDALLGGAQQPRAADDLAPARGIGLSVLFGVLFGVLLWAVLAAALYWVFAG